jgi:AraC family transcriptional regulator
VARLSFKKQAAGFQLPARAMAYARVHKSARQPAAADAALGGVAASMRVVDVAVEAAEFPQHPNPQLKIALILEADALDVGWLSATGRALQGRVTRNTSSVMPAEMPYTTRWHGAGRMLLLSFSPEFMRARDEVVGRAGSELRPAWSQSDPLLVHLGRSVLAAQQAGFASRTYLDAVAEVTMVHLLNRYGAAPAAAPDPLMPVHVARVLDLIESHLDEDLSLARLARVAGLSTYGFARAFTRAVGEPAHRYVIRRRCERARHLLRCTDLPITEVAASLGFSSQAHLTTAFLRTTGTTPGRFRAGARAQ